MVLDQQYVKNRRWDDVILQPGPLINLGLIAGRDKGPSLLPSIPTGSDPTHSSGQ